jgi:hypothetical protein
MINLILNNYKSLNIDTEYIDKLSNYAFLLKSKDTSYLLRTHTELDNQENYCKVVQYIHKHKLVHQNLILSSSDAIVEDKGKYYSLFQLENNFKISKNIFTKEKINNILRKMDNLHASTKVILPLIEVRKAREGAITERINTIKNNLSDGFEKLRLEKDYSASIDRDFFELLVDNLEKYFVYKNNNKELEGLDIEFKPYNFYKSNNDIEYFLSESISKNGYLWSYANLFKTIIESKSEDINQIYKIFENHLEENVGQNENMFFKVIADLVLVQYVYLNLSDSKAQHERAIFNIIKYLNSRNIFKWV